MPRTECSEIFWISFINAQDILAERRIQIFGPVKACCCPLTTIGGAVAASDGWQHGWDCYNPFCRFMAVRSSDSSFIAARRSLWRVFSQDR
jgi:hypothetical protein